jgi:NADH-quinone oxidoreductase subunit J
MSWLTAHVTQVAFWLFAGIAIGAAALCVTRRNPVWSALWLVVTMFQLSAIYVMLDAQFLAVLQVLVYAGAIMVLFLFVIMLLNLGRGGPHDFKSATGIGLGALLAALLLLQLTTLRHLAPPAAITLPPGTLAADQAQQGMIGSVARPLFEAYLVPFEITSLLLLAAIVGAVVLAKKKL